MRGSKANRNEGRPTYVRNDVVLSTRDTLSYAMFVRSCEIVHVGRTDVIRLEGGFRNRKRRRVLIVLIAVDFDHGGKGSVGEPEDPFSHEEIY